MALMAFLFPRARRSEPRGIPAGTFLDKPERNAMELRPIPTKSDVAPRPARDSDAVWEAIAADSYRITLPPDAVSGEVFPDIETALLAAADQLQRTPTQPELPPIADLHRRSKT
jgi:hypothetical protein